MRDRINVAITVLFALLGVAFVAYAYAAPLGYAQ